MNKNQQLELECVALGAELEGVCRHEGMAVFVKGMLPDERGRVVITKTEKRYAFGRLMEVLTKSPQRLSPPCPAYPRFGGCAGLHMTYEATLKAKRQQVEDVMTRIGFALGANEPEIRAAMAGSFMVSAYIIHLIFLS